MYTWAVKIINYLLILAHIHAGGLSEGDSTVDDALAGALLILASEQDHVWSPRAMEMLVALLHPRSGAREHSRLRTLELL